MNDFNIFITISLLIYLFSFMVIVFYIIPKQVIEVLRPRSWITRYRWFLLLLFVFSVLSGIPRMAYQYVTLQGGQDETLRSFAAIMGAVSSLAITLILILLYTYRGDDEL